MFKSIAVGIWVCLMTLAGVYFGTTMQDKGGDSHAADSPPLELLKMKPITVPVVNDTGVDGYLLAVLGYNVDKSKLTAHGTAIEPILQDESFRTLYGVEAVRYKKPRKSDLAEISKNLIEVMNKRLGAEVVKDVLIEELSYIHKDKARSGRMN